MKNRAMRFCDWVRNRKGSCATSASCPMDANAIRYASASSTKNGRTFDRDWKSGFSKSDGRNTTSNCSPQFAWRQTVVLTKTHGEARCRCIATGLGNFADRPVAGLYPLQRQTKTNLFQNAA